MDERGLRITTWNVNGIRNPFGYQPWRQKRTFEAMFDILEADIVVMQEAKIQRKDLQDDMVMLTGWDVYFSLPKHKKGYSGVVIYTRNSVCAPIRAEEGITGALTSPNSTTSYYELPKSKQIGGYPTFSQLADCGLDAAILDSEGRCVVLEFPAFVLIGTYCPANRDETRDEFRIGFLTALDIRVRNLVAMGKKVLLTGDLNIIRDEIDTANAEEQLRKQGITIEQYISTPARRMLNQLLVGGKVVGERDEGREKPVMWDLCRGFHPTRRGMFTCWEQKINARPGNFGSRIDYVLCSEEWKDWFCESNIQEGLMGSDHCPVYAVLKSKVEVGGQEVHIQDLMSAGMFKNGVRQREWSTKDLLPLSAKLIPEFDGRRSIKDMFTRKISLPKGESSTESIADSNAPKISLLPGMGSATGIVDNLPRAVELSLAVRDANSKEDVAEVNEALITQATRSNPNRMSMQEDDSTSTQQSTITSDSQTMPSPAKPALKRAIESSAATRPQKRGKNGSASKAPAIIKGQTGKGQSSLMGFFKPKPATTVDGPTESQPSIDEESDIPSLAPSVTASNRSTPAPSESLLDLTTETISPTKFDPDSQQSIIDPIVAKESWSKLLGKKRVVPKCEHGEPCISMLTKKPGVNKGRSFYMCPRPIGPSGAKEKNSQWRCGTFIWSSEWNGTEES